METKERTQILDAWEIEQTVRRIAHQILEDYYKEKSLYFVGVKGIGSNMAKLLQKEFAKISEIEVIYTEIALNKDKPLAESIDLKRDLSEFKNKHVLLIDDVLNSGRTLIYAAAHLLDSAPKSLRTVVLVDRTHRKFPIRADYVGMTLSTNLKEHVAVEKEGRKYAAYLQ